MFTRHDIERRVERLAPLSDTAQALMRLLSDPEHDFEDVVRIVENDSALALRVLGLANSSAYWAAGDFDTVSRAASYLGERTIFACAMDQGAEHLFGTELVGYCAARGANWHNSLHTAVAAQVLASRARQPVNGLLAYTGAILRDIGKVVASDLLEGQDLEAIIDSVTIREVEDFCAAERQVLGFSHPEIGAMVCEKFGVSANLREIVLYHHRPAGADELYWREVACVHVADILAMLVGAERSVDNLSYRMDPDASALFGLSDAELSEVVCEFSVEVDKLMQAFAP